MEIDPDEIFLDSRNLPDFNVHQMEGRLEKPIPRRTVILIFAGFLLIASAFSVKLWLLQIHDGSVFAARSERNRLRNTVLFSERGVIYDRNGIFLASNTTNPDSKDFSLRKYIDKAGFGHLLGYVKYPAKDSSGFYYEHNYVGKDGVEKWFNEYLSGKNGLKIVETNALGKVETESVANPPILGKTLTLSIDARIQEEMYRAIQSAALKIGFSGGAGIVMDVKTGEIISLTSFPEYKSNAMTDGDSAAIKSYLANKNNPFLDRVVSGLYTPGSIVKPFFAMAALAENTIDPEKIIISTGSISIPNPYDASKPTVFKDWKALGPMNMRSAIAWSSDVYFYAVGGGYKDQIGLGILNLEKYAKIFGFGSKTGVNLDSEQSGLVPNPEWKKKMFNGDDWRVGNTYHTSIGQYGFQVTPIQAVRAVASLANYGTLVTPTVELHGNDAVVKNFPTINFPKHNFDIIHDGMRMGVTSGVATALNVPYVKYAAKTGTAELGVSKELVNSWITGFFPYEDPKYAFAIVMEKGSRNNLVGASAVMRDISDWMYSHTPEYFGLAPVPAVDETATTTIGSLGL
ncbi:MAG: penicillin-binding transpeptidase domain-containing protein [Candidatus Paceibacterota bacterium]